jgi:hypothetical protein
VHRRESATTRVLAGFLLAPVAIAAATCLLVSGCSPGADYPSLFPAVHDMPPPRPDTPLDPVQVQQATEDLITARDHLSAEMQGSGQPKTPPAAARQVAAKPADKTADKKKQPTADAPAAAAGSKPTATDGAQTAGAETKP